MTDHDDTDGTTAGADPWAPGGAMSRAPVPPAAPVSFGPDHDPGDAPDAPDLVQRPRGRGIGTGPGESDSAPAPAITFEPSGDRRANRPGGGDGHHGDQAGADRHGEVAHAVGRGRWAGRRPRPAFVAGALAVAVAVAVAGIWSAVRDDPSGGQPEAEPAATPPTEPAASASTEPPVASDPPTVAPAEAPLQLDEPFELSIRVPDALPHLGPIELLVLTGSGLLQVEIPTGRVQRLYGDPTIEHPQAAFTDNAAVVWNHDNAHRVMLVPRVGAPVEIDLPGPVGRVVAERDDEFLLLVTNGEHRRLSVDPVVWTRRVEITVGDPWSAAPHPSGGVMISGDLGTYLIDGGSPEVISGGFVVAIGRNHVVTRSCAEGEGCKLILDDERDGTRIELPDVLDDEVLPGTSSFTLSPDGGALTRSQFGVETGPAIRIIEVATGNTVDVPTTAASLPAKISWEPGGRGFFALIDHGVVYVDRATGNIVEVLAGFEIFDIAARPAPAASEPATEATTPFSVALSGPTGVDLIGVTDGGVVEIDLDEQAYAFRSGLPIDSGAPRFVFVDGGGVTVASWDNVPGYRIDDSGVAPVDPDALSGPVFPGPVAGSAWRARRSAGFEGVTFDLVTTDGALLGPAVELAHAALLGSDGRGGLLVSAGGGVFEATAAGARQLATGELVASGPNHLFVRDCDEALTCSVTRLDRATGESTPVIHPVIADAVFDPGGVFVAGSSVSPDGEVVLVRPTRAGLAWTLVDLATGSEIEVPGPRDGTGLVWSADSQYGAFISGDVLRVYDRATATLQTADELPRLRALAAVPPTLPPGEVESGPADPAGFTRRGAAPHGVR